jgi:hypothetical protein
METSVNNFTKHQDLYLIRSSKLPSIWNEYKEIED